MKTPAPHGKINFPARKIISNKNGTKGKNLKKLEKNPEFQKKSFAEKKDNHYKSRAHVSKEVKEINYPGGKLKTPTPHGKMNFSVRKQISNRNGTKGKNPKKVETNPEFLKNSFAENDDNGEKSRAHFPKEVMEINYPGGKMKSLNEYGKKRISATEKIPKKSQKKKFWWVGKVTARNNKKRLQHGKIDKSKKYCKNNGNNAGNKEKTPHQGEKSKSQKLARQENLETGGEPGRAAGAAPACCH